MNPNPSSGASSIRATISVIAATTAIAVGFLALALGMTHPVFAAALLFAGSTLFFMPLTDSVFGRNGCNRKVPQLLCIAAAVAIQIWLFAKGSVYGELFPLRALLLWIAAVSLLLLAALRSDLNSSRQRCFETADWKLAGLFFLLALACRLLGPQSFTVDEAGVFIEVMRSYPRPLGAPWAWSSDNFPMFIHDSFFAVSVGLRSFFDPIDTMKFVVCFVSAISVAAWYLVVRLFAPRFLASSAAILLLFFGLHWVNSRFLYLYPFDMASLTVGILCIVLAFERKLLFPAAMTGVSLAFAVSGRRIGLIMVPLFAYICMDYLLGTPRGERGRAVRISLVVIAATLFTYTPIFFNGDPFGNLDRIAEAATAHRSELARFGMTSGEALLAILGDSLWQFFVAGYDVPRHLLRMNAPLLDPVFSALFPLGAVSMLLSLNKRRASRFQAVGLFLTVLPMALTFPLDSAYPHGLARRMNCSSFFLAWIAAVGSAALTTRLAKGSIATVLTIGLCIASLGFNAYYVAALYFKPSLDVWHYDYRVSSRVLIDFARKTAAQGTKVVVLNHAFLGTIGTHPDLPLVVDAKSLDELRAELRAPFNGSRMVVIPTLVVTNFPAEIYSQLADVVPATLWVDGPPDMQAVPQFRYAELPANQTK